MARAGEGWVNTTRNDHIQEFNTSNLLQRPNYLKKVQHLPPLNVNYDTPRLLNDKQWSDQSLFSTRSVNTYLAESDGYQRASFANIVEKWKEHDKNKTNQLITSFDTHYNMKIRFRHDDQLNRSSEKKYGSGATYYRFLGDETKSKRDKPCGRHKRRTQDYQERHLRELLQVPTIIKTRSQPYFLPKITHRSAPGQIAHTTTTTARSSVSLVEPSHHSFS